MLFIFFLACTLMLLFLAILLLGLLSRTASRKHLEKPPNEGKFFDAHGARLFYRVKGRYDPTIIVFNAPGSASCEWWAVQNEVTTFSRMICLDRPGYGRSTKSPHTRTASQVATELDMLLKFERTKKPLILLAHGFAAGYALHYARTHEQAVAGIIFINPYYMHHAKWQKSLHDFEEYVDLEQYFKRRMKLSRKGAFRLINPLKGYSLDKRYRSVIIEHYNAFQSYECALSEIAALDEVSTGINPAQKLNHIPIKLIYSGNESIIRDYLRRGIPEYSARQMSQLYQEQIKVFMGLSQKARFTEIESCGESLHLSNPQMLAREIENFVTEVRQKENQMNMKQAVHC